MTALLIIIAAVALLVVGYIFYGSWLAKQWGIDPTKKTPAYEKQDGVDYVPTRAPVLFGHHFASIAGPGPIVGPIMAAYFGWLPALIWILVGCVFIGAFHDFAALVISVRNRGRSVSFVMEKMMGFTGRQLFLGFCLLCLVLVVAIFTLLIAGLFTKFPEVATASLLFIFMAPLFAFTTINLNFSLKRASVIFIPLVFLSVYLGESFPLNVETAFNIAPENVRSFWIGVLAIYIFVASVMPVQWLLLPQCFQ